MYFPIFVQIVNPLRMESKLLRVGIIGAGHIARKAARTLNAMTDMTPLAIGSRSLEKARAFAVEEGVARAYGSYEALLDDPDVDLVYVATPHSHHFDVTRSALGKGKACLVEKAFMANAAQTREIFALSRERHVFVGEAIWTRYMPASLRLREMIREGRIGTLRSITAGLSYAIAQKERILRKELCGGALLDLGVYVLNFMRICNDRPVVQVSSACRLFETGTDRDETLSLTLDDGTLACLTASADSVGWNIGVAAGTEGCLVVDNVNNPTRFSLYRSGGVLEETVDLPSPVTGFEFEFRACRDAMAAGAIEPPQMPHAEILYIMELMDSLRRAWGVRFPMDPWE